MLPILTITGSDSTGGSGVQADIKTIFELGGYAVSAITSITVQNTLGIQEFFDIPAEIVSGQIEAIMNDMQPNIVKVGMIRKVETLNVLIDALTKYRPDHIIYAPSIWSSQGDALMTEDVVSQIKYRLLPLCSVVVARKKESDIILQNSRLLELAEKQGLRIYRLDNANSHGLINRFSSALAIYLNQGKKMEEALAMAQDFINIELVRESNLQGRSSELYNQFISQVNNFCRTYSDVHFYADQLNVSGRYLAQVTRRISGKTPKAIIDEYIFLPDAGTVLSKLLPEYVQVQVYNAMLQSAASELGSRMAAMSAATDNATERIADLNLTYNKARQAQVTNEISEIVGGAAALE